ncbi:hypothetical protein AKJ39_00380 [candidate division MSBL1 archaeon SCGC-AAA259J03]|uniref:Uncharacterized protein n=1 Tax=candidate division MSBL1 archaeon SCGC-AAA259J03 TaxID=1698269 RepID=A0A656YXJ6_9EURY|nr:hypothetical protein AKJ39_00380 [candidate division MSBL1 archaeon SCGC-AAA259J03]
MFRETYKGLGIDLDSFEIDVFSFCPVLELLIVIFKKNGNCNRWPNNLLLNSPKASSEFLFFELSEGC